MQRYRNDDRGPGRALAGLGHAMEQYVDGNAHAFETVYHLVGSRVRAYALSKLGDPSAAEDIVQDTFLKAHRARFRFKHSTGDPDGAVMAWYVAIARNTIIDRGRVLRRSRVAAAEIESLPNLPEQGRGPAGPEDALIEKQARETTIRRVRRAVGSLPPQQREIVEMHKFRHLSMASIASRLHVRAPTLRVRAHRAYRMLAKVLHASAA